MKEVVHQEYQAASSHWWFRARRSIFERFLDECVDLPEHARILDIGPGSGINLPILGERGRVTVLDMSRDSLVHCRDAGARDVVQGDGVTPPFADRSFDLVCALDVLEHLPDDAGALSAWRDVLHPNGRLLLSVPALQLLWGRQDVLSDHQRRYRKGQLARLLRSAGFETLRLTYFNSLLFPPILAVRLAMRPFLARSSRNGGSDLSMPSFGMSGMLYHLFAMEGGWLTKRDLPLGVSLLCLARPG